MTISWRSERLSLYMRRCCSLPPYAASTVSFRNSFQHRHLLRAVLPTPFCSSRRSLWPPKCLKMMSDWSSGRADTVRVRSFSLWKCIYISQWDNKTAHKGLVANTGGGGCVSAWSILYIPPVQYLAFAPLPWLLPLLLSHVFVYARRGSGGVGGGCNPPLGLPSKKKKLTNYRRGSRGGVVGTATTPPCAADTSCQNRMLLNDWVLRRGKALHKGRGLQSVLLVYPCCSCLLTLSFVYN